MALPVNGSTHLIPAILLIYRPRKDKRLSWPSWLTCSGRFTHISGHPSAAGRAQDRESSPVRDRRSTTVPRHQRMKIGSSISLFSWWLPYRPLYQRLWLLCLIEYSLFIQNRPSFNATKNAYSSMRNVTCCPDQRQLTSASVRVWPSTHIHTALTLGLELCFAFRGLVIEATIAGQVLASALPDAVRLRYCINRTFDY